MEKNSNTPDFILAEYLTMCLHAFDKATQRRHEWYKEIDRLNNFICEDGVKLEKLRDEIEKLNADNENMREALKKCIELCVCQTESEMFIDQAKEALQEGAE
jgi:septal ring factor EnvC (AmiA/AmiB activator)